MKQTLKIIAASAIATAIFLKAAPALAETAPAQNVSIVHVGDLDLTTRAGQRALEQRLVIAAHEVCGRASDVDLAGKNQVRACRHNVLAEARERSAAVAGAGRPSAIEVAAAR